MHFKLIVSYVSFAALNPPSTGEEVARPHKLRAHPWAGVALPPLPSPPKRDPPVGLPSRGLPSSLRSGLQGRVCEDGRGVPSSLMTAGAPPHGTDTVSVLFWGTGLEDLKPSSRRASPPPGSPQQGSCGLRAAEPCQGVVRGGRHSERLRGLEGSLLSRPRDVNSVLGQDRVWRNARLISVLPMVSARPLVSYIVHSVAPSSLKQRFHPTVMHLRIDFCPQNIT